MSANMEDMPEAQRLRIDAAMLESLSDTFKLLDAGGPFSCSFNFGDVADLLQRCAARTKPGPVVARITEGNGG